MLGIYCVVDSNGQDSLQPRLSRLNSPGSACSGVWRSASGHVAGALVAPHYRLQDSAYRDGDGDWVLIDGVVLDPAGNRAMGARELLALLRRSGPEAFWGLNGEYLILASVEQDVWLVSDRMALRQHCIARNSGRIAIAPAPGDALGLCGQSREIHSEALLTFLLSNKLRLDEQTIWRHCETMPAASQYHVAADGDVSHRQYWRLAFQPDAQLTPGEIAEEATEIFQNAVSARVGAGGKLGMTLTGGLDSRLMAGAVEAGSRRDILCSTMGIAGCDEIELAKQVAARAGYAYREVNLLAGTAFDPRNADFLADEDIDLLIQHCWQPFLQANADRDVILHGLDLDVTLGGIYLTQELESVESVGALTDYALKNALSGPMDYLVKLFRKDIMVDAAENIRARIEGMLQASREDSLLNTYDHFILQFSMHRVILQRYRAIRRFVDTLTPMYDRHLIDFYLRMPPEARAQHKVFQQVLMRTCPELADIPYQRTSLPPSVPTAYWREGQRLESQREELSRRVARETHGRSYVPYLHYYTNVDEWLRFDPVWMRACDELLLSPRSVIRDRYLNEPCLRELVAEHQSHERSHMKILHILMSAELFLRRAEGANLSELFETISFEGTRACR